MTVTSPEGYAIGHGCARPDRAIPASPAPPTGTSPAGLPARLNLTIPATALPSLTGRTSHHAGPVGRSPAAAARAADRRGPAGRLRHLDARPPGGRRFTVRLDLCPPSNAITGTRPHGYQPSDRLRHLVQVRDGTCTFPPCNRHARESDFEHALPYDKGGRTCACNAGARSRACHRVKQSPGWQVTQPSPAGTSGRPRPAASTCRNPSDTRPDQRRRPAPASHVETRRCDLQRWWRSRGQAAR